jgi:hypothetical protein
MSRVGPSVRWSEGKMGEQRHGDGGFWRSTADGCRPRSESGLVSIDGVVWIWLGVGVGGAGIGRFGSKIIDETQ